jgi:hypothetical protein
MVLTIQEILFQWESIGVFDILLPFLLIFAVVFGALSYANVFGNNKAINGVIAIVVGLIAVRFPFFTAFYQEIFPRVGIGIVILISLLLLSVMFWTEKSRVGFLIGLASVGLVIGLIIIYQSSQYLGWTGFGGFGSETVGWIIGALLFLGLLIAIIIGNIERDPNRTKDQPYPGFLFNPIQPK